ncbi:hypothetical protein L227DRAFT_561572 [Lentinus tigrinus ALCF2SS1-6]|uniref:Uncharacterized protein n=1 Tax=Lentinus tigrinus ALCF2SS1-6 TaxID=1328759 RepID=A0A5C2SJY4_9APHY|nr:hypothetical protein L227DRAFT_561572 [Lentinus tigrinus ALCF2SS1-6]
MLVALGDHSAMYFAKNIAAPAQVKEPPPLLLAYTALPGYYGVEEEESEMTLSSWYLFQEARWTADYGFDVAEDGNSGAQADERGRDMMPVAEAVYTELVSVLRRMVVWPPRAVLGGWARDQRKKYSIICHFASARDVALVVAAVVLGRGGCEDSGAGGTE